jgi:hypothetical protein
MGVRACADDTDGQVVLLTSLCDDQYAAVLQMPAVPRVKTEADESATIVCATIVCATIVASEPRSSFVA